ncbi:MAG: hypothetical protein KKC72_14160, partial [Alphaproteobacteria bacterium]|nr:hypothetical protein [Alphaproteobacteria bacterium]MBU1835265.1 hypothetical protein [Alphaproteobacteria bacterium]
MRVLFALAPLAFAAACAGSGPAVDGITPAGVDKIVDMTATLNFAPNAVTINSGDTVEFRNISTFTHTVSTVADTQIEAQAVKLPNGAEAFDSGEIAPGATFTHTFTTPGTYQYFCEP